MNKHGLCQNIDMKTPKGDRMVFGISATTIKNDKVTKQDFELIKIGLTEFNAHYRMDRL